MAKPRIPESVQLEKLAPIAAGRYTFTRIGEYTGTKGFYQCTCLVHGTEFKANLNNLLRGLGCRKCGNEKMASMAQLDPAQMKAKLESIVAGRYSVELEKEAPLAKNTMWTCECPVDGHRWSLSYASITKGCGCPACGTRVTAQKKTTPEANRLERLAAIAEGRYTFKRSGDYLGKLTRYDCTCLECEGEWSAVDSNLTSSGTGCPFCQESGYRKGKPGSLYALMSHCGLFIKIGISNNPERRMRELTRQTPFSWHQIAQVDSQDGVQIAEWEREIHSQHEKAFAAGEFPGSTEWLKTDRLPELLETLTKLTAEAA